MNESLRHEAALCGGPLSCGLCAAQTDRCVVVRREEEAQRATAEQARRRKLRRVRRALAAGRRK